MNFLATVECDVQRGRILSSGMEARKYEVFVRAVPITASDSVLVWTARTENSCLRGLYNTNNEENVIAKHDGRF